MSYVQSSSIAQQPSDMCLACTKRMSDVNACWYRTTPIPDIVRTPFYHVSLLCLEQLDILGYVATR